MPSWPFESDVQRVVALLIRQEYAKLAGLEGSRVSAEELEQVVRDYSRRLVMPPRDRQPPLGVVRIQDSEPVRWSVDVPLWSGPEGRSDLTLQLTVTEQPGGAFSVAVDDLHVL
jgi:hypothetical protein